MLFMNLIITGNPGVGKHTVAAQIMKNEDYDMIDINKIAIESNYIETVSYTHLTLPTICSV